LADSTREQQHTLPRALLEVNKTAQHLTIEITIERARTWAAAQMMSCSNFQYAKPPY
jgi:hypothetical protein